jgi:transcriptional regulator with XRE-family HTH domain
MAFDIVGMGNRIRIARQDKDLKQHTVSNKLNMSQPNYSNIESGNQDISVSQLIDIAAILDVPVLWLLGINSIPDLTDSERLEVEKYIRYIISIRKKQ